MTGWELLPGVTAAALCGIAVLCQRPADTTNADAPQEAGPRRVRMLAGAAGAVLVLAIGGASLLRGALGDHYLDDAQSALPVNPAVAVADARKVLLGDLESRAGDVPEARRDYRRALSLDPREPGLRSLAANPLSDLTTSER